MRKMRSWLCMGIETVKDLEMQLCSCVVMRKCNMVVILRCWPEVQTGMLDLSLHVKARMTEVDKCQG